MIHAIHFIDTLKRFLNIEHSVPLCIAMLTIMYQCIVFDTHSIFCKVSFEHHFTVLFPGIPVSHINAKPGRCPQPLGISALQDTTVGCWLDTNCPGIQKCCLEPNPVTNTATRICRDPEGISSDSVCNLPLAIGSCTAPSIRYYYDASAGRCNSMTYSGCGGNANNFQSLASCQATCSGSGS